MKKKVIGGLLIATTLGMTTLAVAQSDGQYGGKSDGQYGGKNGIANMSSGFFADKNSAGEVASELKGENSEVGASHGTLNGKFAGTGNRSEQGKEAVQGAHGKVSEGL